MNKNIVKRKVQQGLNSNSKRVQFPINEKLPNSERHRYYLRYGFLQDRLTGSYKIL